VTTIGDFRPADMAAGGQGAPLVPFVDYLLYRDAKIGRAALNIGGIANVTVIPASAKPKDVFAFDTGPGNMIIDALVERITHGRERFDRDAKLASRGWTSERLLAWFMRDPYLHLAPPKTAGREQFGEAYVERAIAAAKRFRVSGDDLIRTATVFTSLSIAQAMRRFVLPKAGVEEVVVAGGGARNPLMMAQLAAGLPEIAIVDAEQFGVAAQAKEAFAFAVLAYEAFQGRANNLPAATGARFSVAMGKRVAGRV
jgi:anhydro-N-acetylmuramic acid kinase